MKQNITLSSVSDNSDTIFNSIKKYLLDTEKITENFTDNMIWQYLKTYVSNVANVQDELVNILSSLIDLGVINTDTSLDEIPSIIKNICENTDPYILSYGAKIGNVSGKLRHTPDMWDDTSDLYAVNKYFVGTKRYIFTIKGDDKVFSMVKGAREHKTLIDGISNINNIIEISDDKFYISGYSSATKTLYIYYVDGESCVCVYQHVLPDFYSAYITMYTIPGEEYCYFSAYAYAPGGTSTVLSSSCTGIYYLNGAMQAIQVCGVFPYTSKNGYAWSLSFVDSFGNCYFSAFRDNSTLYSVHGVQAHEITGVTGYDFDNFFETSTGDIYFWSNYNLVALCWLNPQTYEGHSICYGRYWQLIETEDGGVYAVTTQTASANPGILKVNRSEYKKIIDTGRWKLLQDQTKQVYGITVTTGAVYCVNDDSAELLFNIGHDEYSVYTNPDNGHLYLFYDSTETGWAGELPKAYGVLINNKTYTALGTSYFSQVPKIQPGYHGYFFVYAGSFDVVLHCIYNDTVVPFTYANEGIGTYSRLYGRNFTVYVDGLNYAYTRISTNDDNYTALGDVIRVMNGNTCIKEFPTYGSFNYSYYGDDGAIYLYPNEKFTSDDVFYKLYNGEITKFIPIKKG